MVVRLSAVALTALFAAGVVFAQQRNYLLAEIENGGRIYQANCAGCHGAEGDGVAGTNFGTGRIRRASSDDDLVRIIIGGIPGTPMPPSNFSEGQAATIVAYLRSMATAAPGTTSATATTATAGAAKSAPASGDVSRGRSVLEGKGQCLTCHSVNGSGSRVGPNLTDIGAVRRSSELERSLLEPDAEIRAENRTVRAVTRDGATITGRLLNQDSFTLQLLDAANERLVSIAKANLREYAVLRNSPMPSYRDKLSAQELADVVSYLASLKGRQ
jgi:putative heme-binding domain-containing protein